MPPHKRFQSRYKAEHSLEFRKSEASKAVERYTDRLPIIVEKVEGSSIPEIDRNKFLVPADISLGQFVLVVRKRVEIQPEQALFLFIGENIPSNTTIMSDLYAKHKDDDGFLYLCYAAENTFGHQ